MSDTSNHPDMAVLVLAEMRLLECQCEELYKAVKGGENALARTICPDVKDSADQLKADVDRLMGELRETLDREVAGR